MNKINRISVSGIETFADCPRKYKFQYVDRIYRPSNEHFIFGSLGHKINELVGQGVEDEVIYDFIEHSKELGSVQKSLEKLGISDVLSLAKMYVEETKKLLSHYTIIKTEQKIIHNNHVGVIDLIAVEEDKQKLLILDYKFSGYPKTVDDITGNLQLYMYAYLLNYMKGIKEILKKYKIKYIYLGYFTLSKVEKKLPARLKSGALSKAVGAKGVTYETYLEAIKLYDLNRTDYEIHLHKLKNKTDTTVSFVELKLSPNDLEEKMKELDGWTKLIEFAIKNDHFPGRNSWNCKDCSIKKQCKNHL